jgi:hypothetical protein
MTVSLGGLTLSDELVLDIKGAGVGYSQTRLIGGASVVQADGSSGGRTLTLTGEHHWTLAQVTAIQAMQSVGQAVSLVHHRGTFTVLIVDTSTLEPSIPYANPQSTDWYSGSLTLIEV